MHPSKCSSVRRVLLLDLTIHTTLNSCSQRKVLPNTISINHMSFLTSNNYFSFARWHRIPENVLGLTKHTSGPRSDHILITPVLLFYSILMIGWIQFIKSITGLHFVDLRWWVTWRTIIRDCCWLEISVSKELFQRPVANFANILYCFPNGCSSYSQELLSKT
jgi:hypothetical protein